MNRQDLEYKKFSLSNLWNIRVKNRIVTKWDNLTWINDIVDLESKKFDTNWNVRLALTF